jgi:hypothetical protein
MKVRNVTYALPVSSCRAPRRPISDRSVHHDEPPCFFISFVMLVLDTRPRGAGASLSTTANARGLSDRRSVSVIPLILDFGGRLRVNV